MTIAATSIRTDYTGSGITGPYTFPFPVFAIADLKVISTNLVGVDTTLVLNTDYTVVGIKAPTDYTQGGTITLTVALTTGFHLAIVSNELGIQSTSIKNNSAYYAYLHENQFDYRSLFSLQLAEKLNKAVVAPDSEPAGTCTLTLPAKSLRASKSLGFDANGNIALVTGTSTTVTFSATGTTVAGIASLAALLQLLGLYIGPAAVANNAALLAIASPGSGWLAYQTDTGQFWGYNTKDSAWEQISWSLP